MKRFLVFLLFLATPILAKPLVVQNVNILEDSVKEIAGDEVEVAKPLVVTSFSILGDMVKEIAGDKVEVKSLVEPNQDPHVFEPRPQHAKDLARADLVVVNGLGFEGWLDRLISASGFQGDLLVATTGVTPLMHAHHHTHHAHHDHGVFDPHAWHSLKNAPIYIDNIVEGLSRLVPEEASFFKARAAAYKKEVEVLEAQTHEELDHLPVESKKVLTNHEAFGYLGHDFQIVFYSPLGISTESEPSAKAVATLIDRIKKDKIQAVFVENISNSRLVERIAEETGTQVGGILYSDALDVPGTQADTYLKMMRFNLNSLVKAMRKNAEVK
jgi:zinc/manganese transport system substrate-binding protein